MEPQAEIHVPESARKDKEHRHVWKYDSPSYDYERVMCDCGEILGWDEIIRRLNATECLSAEIAESAADHCGDLIESYEPENSALRNYANERTGATSS